MTPFVAELIGTAILIIFGNGVVSNVVLNKTKGHGSGWIVITFGWGMGVFVAVFCVADVSGAHINPAVTVAAAAFGSFPWADVPGYVLAQMIGATLGGGLVYWFYHGHFRATDDPALKLACFATAPEIRSVPNNFFCEFIGTFMLVFPIFMMTDPTISAHLVAGGGSEAAEAGTIGLGTLGALPVGLLVFAIGLSLGGTTGYAINPARDLGPRIAHAILVMRGRAGSDWAYAWVPVAAPLAGGVAAAIAAKAALASA